MPRKSSRCMKSYGSRPMSRKPRNSMDSHRFSDDDVPNSQSSSLKLEASRRVKDMQRTRRENVSAHDRKTGLFEQSAPHGESSAQAVVPSPYRPKASERTKPARLAGFKLLEQGGLTWFCRRPKLDGEQAVEDERPMKFLA